MITNGQKDLHFNLLDLFLRHFKFKIISKILQIINVCTYTHVGFNQVTVILTVKLLNHIGSYFYHGKCVISYDLISFTMRRCKLILAGISAIF